MVMTDLSVIEHACYGAGSESEGDLGKTGKTDSMMKRFRSIGVVIYGSLAEVIGEPGMVSPPQLVDDELGSRDP
ncbi:hypothetical protein THAOC_25509 [Thalassiosira oceanica]|uniref:Uncharacterized protein n=1 Tax=Thalassiosira oceanica TaxID=159749 RepID=K0RR21_THAOC|nr:hypothetical protein THAOC_25509 [Thalassiosira oceanica]|eukprot:EJK54829.1 hypothetical protein THAOC_25509 [Thalassiosira oceanica]